VPAFYYSSTAGAYTLTGAVSAAATTIVLNSVTGLPTSTPYKVVLEPGQPGEEIVKVTAVAGTSLTVVRGWNGTAAASHDAGSAVRHMVTAEDFTLSRSHEDATTAHGATGAVVGTTNTQSLTNKDLSSGTNVFPSTLVTVTGSQALTNKNLSDATNVFPSSLATLTGAQALTNKDLSDATNVFPSTLVTTTATQTLSGKTLTSPVINGATGDGAAFTGNVTAANLLNATSATGGKRIHVGSITATIQAGGIVNIAHALGWTPTVMIATANTSGSLVCTAAEATSSTNVRFLWYFASTGAAATAGGSITFSYIWLG
jgi:hypothetical protein